MNRYTFATALITAAASACDLTAIPDYTAGFIYGMTGANHLEEIENCYSGSQDLAQLSHDALVDIKNGQWVKGLNSLRQVFEGFPDALAGCKDIDEDLATIADWATIFIEPV